MASGGFVARGAMGVVGIVCGLAVAQPSAEIEITCGGGGSFQWVPITATVRVLNPGASSLAVIRGSLVVTTNSGPATGTTQGFTSQFSGAPSNLGVQSGLSRMGMSLGGFPGVYPGGTYTIAQYEMLVDQPGQIFYARWVPDPGFEQVRVHVSPVLPAIAPVPTSNLSEAFYVGGCCPPPICRADLTWTAIAGAAGYGIPSLSVNNDDFFYYLDRFAVGDRSRCDMTATAVPGSPGYGFPNGVLNNDDFFFYLALFSGGC